MKTDEVMFSVQPTAEKTKTNYRLYPLKKYSSGLFSSKKRHAPAYIVLDTVKLFVRLTCGNENKDFDLYDKQISLWNTFNSFHLKKCNLVFKYSVDGDKIFLKFKKAVDNK